MFPPKPKPPLAKINNAKIGKNKKNEKIRKVKLTKGINAHKKYILLKPQVINSITINNSETIVHNRYNKTKKEINSKNDNKIINEVSVNPDYNIININPNISYYNNYKDSFNTKKQKINSIKYSNNMKEDGNNTNIYNIFSCDKKSSINNFVYKPEEKILFSDKTYKTYAANKTQINNNKVKEKMNTGNNIDQSKRYKKFNMNKLRQIILMQDKKYSLSP